MSVSDIEKLIEDQVNCKVKELSSWKKVRWEGGRLYYETQKIMSEISGYETKIQILYLEKLYKKRFIIQDNWPHSAPDITSDLKNWIQKSISIKRVSHLQQTTAKSATERKRARIPNKI